MVKFHEVTKFVVDHGVHHVFGGSLKIIGNTDGALSRCGGSPPFTLIRDPTDRIGKFLGHELGQMPCSQSTSTLRQVIIRRKNAAPPRSLPLFPLHAGNQAFQIFANLRIRTRPGNQQANTSIFLRLGTDGSAAARRTHHQDFRGGCSRRNNFVVLSDFLSCHHMLPYLSVRYGVL